MKTVIDLSIFTITVWFMVTVGMSLEAAHFRELARLKKTVVLILIVQPVFLPLLGILVARMLVLPLPVSAGILLLTACPVGDIANLFTLLAQANVALSLTINTLTCLLSVVTMAVIFKAYGFLLGDHFVFAVPTPTLLARLALMVMLPVMFGMVVRKYLPEFVRKHTKTMRALCILGLAFLLLYVMVSQYEKLATAWLAMARASALMIGLTMFCGIGFGRILRLNSADTVTAAIVFSVRNVGLATAIAVTLLNRIEFAGFAVAYFLTEVPLLLALVAAYRCWWSQFGGKQDMVLEI